ncbi:hypothetical protein ACOT7R_17805 [Clostridium perfringens]|uniref:hypothetical protein n=1 Tax=Clostridium perfringens TaxID=1502 RepID=UPI0028FE6FC2|nr:hypothetical protein [Clostridium perfringens]MDU3020501.1 hypothetical protein [Clostridium perfringens]
MKYSVTISKEELCDFDFLKNNFKKEKIQGVFKDNIIQVIQALIALSIGFIISFGLIALNMRMDIKTILLNKIITLSNIDIKIILLILSYLPFIVILFFQIVCLGLFLKFYYRLKYSYLIGTFEIYIKENIIILDSKYRKFFIDLSKCKKKKIDDILVLTKENGFKVLLPIEKIQDGKSLENTIIKMNKGENI